SVQGGRARAARRPQRPMTLGTVPASRRRLDRARDYLATSGVGALLLVKTENRRYVTGFTGSAGLALIAPAEAFLAVDFRYEEQAAAEATACTVLRGGRDPLAALSAAVAGRSLGTIGFESEFVPFAQVTRLREKLAPAELVPLATVDRLRWTKDVTEVAAIARAVEIADAAFAHIAGVLRPGLSERDVAVELEMCMRRFGAERLAFESVVASGPRAALPCRAVDERARSVIAAAGFGEAFGHSLGHGLGLEVHEGPRLSPQEDAVLEPGMVVTVEPGIYLPGWGGVRIEDNVVVTADGCRNLTRAPKELEIPLRG